jgi:hypothetical protein
MGKRELLLIVGFVMVGTMVYLATAPEPAPGEGGFSISRILEEVKREIRGNPGSAEVTTTTMIPLKTSITELRFDDPRSANITVVGEDRTDLGCELLVWSNGASDVEATKYANETKLRYTNAGSTLAIGVDYPQPADQRATLKVRVPKNLAVRVQPSRGKLELTDLASVEVVEARGQVAVRRISNRLVITHRGGPLTLEGIASLKLNSRGSNVTVKDLRGQASLQMQAGELRGSMLGGPTEVESNGTRITIEGSAPAQKPLRLTTVGGSATLTGVTSDVRIDARDTRVDVVVDKPAPIAIYTEGDDPLTIALPPRGFELEALAIDSRLVVPEGLPEVKTSGNEQRASGPVGGGGPTITLRASRAEMTIKINDGPATTPPAGPGSARPAPPAPPAPPRPPR